MLKKKISESKQIHDLPDDTCRLLFTWLIAHLDVAGCFYGEPELIKNKVFPRRTDLTVEKIEEYLKALEAQNNDGGWPLIVRYKAKGERYLVAPSFADHQGFRRDLKDKSQFPLPPNDIVKKLKRSSKEVEEKLLTSADKDKDKDKDQDQDRDKDKDKDSTTQNGQIRPTYPQSYPQGTEGLEQFISQQEELQRIYDLQSMDNTPNKLMKLGLDKGTAYRLAKKVGDTRVNIAIEKCIEKLKRREPIDPLQFIVADIRESYRKEE